MVHIDPLTLVKSTSLRCFGEKAQDQLVRYLEIFLPNRPGVNIEISPEGGRSARGPGRARAPGQARVCAWARVPL